MTYGDTPTECGGINRGVTILDLAPEADLWPI